MGSINRYTRVIFLVLIFILFLGIVSIFCFSRGVTGGDPKNLILAQYTLSFGIFAALLITALNSNVRLQVSQSPSMIINMAPSFDASFNSP
jgi:hypothetical protein